jgi:hypothetical protein
MRLAWAIVLGVLAAIVVACSSKGSSAPDRLCTPNANVFCRCQDKSEGTKKCSGDGQSFGECQPCGGLPDPQVKDPPPQQQQDPPPPPDHDAAPPPDPDAGPDGDPDAPPQMGPLCASLSVCCDQLTAGGYDATTCEGVVTTGNEDACNAQHEQYKSFGDCS